MTIASSLYKVAFRVGSGLGIHPVKRHFYSPIPDLRSIPESYWQRESELPSLNMNQACQLELLPKFASLPAIPYADSLGPVDAEVLYGMVSLFRPAKVIEIGRGHSTTLIEMAGKCEHVCIEPYAEFPTDGVRVIRQPVQDVALAEFESLRENDILFIDSSHVLKEASDVRFEYLEILPRLAQGVLVHIHDVFLPLPYPKQWVAGDLRFWNEQYLLQAFLAFNSAFEVLWAGSWMATYHEQELRKVFPQFTRERMPGSFWIRKIN